MPGAHRAARKIRASRQGCRGCGGDLMIAAPCSVRTRTVAEALPHRVSHLALE